MRKHYLLIPSITVLHLMASLSLLLMSAGLSARALETGAKVSLLARTATMFGRILLYPVFIPASESFARSSGVVGWTLLIVNSLIWAVAVTYLLRVLAAHRRRMSSRLLLSV